MRTASMTVVLHSSPSFSDQPSVLPLITLAEKHQHFQLCLSVFALRSNQKAPRQAFDCRKSALLFSLRSHSALCIDDYCCIGVICTRFSTGCSAH